MTFLLDHLTAVVVGTVLLAALLVLQVRGQQTAIEASERNRSQALAAEFMGTLVREIENARGRDETERIFALGDDPLAPTVYRFRIARATAADGEGYTRQLSFPTVLDPARLDDSPLGIVTYTVEETGQTVFVDGRDRPLLRARRFVFPRGGPITETGVYERIVDFDVTAFEPDGTRVTSRLALSETPVRLHVELRYAPEITDFADDPGEAARVSTRFARTVRIPASTAYEDRALDLGDAPGGIPPLPGDEGFEGGGGSTPPSDGGSSTPPADGGGSAPPADGGTSTPPADGGGSTPPADGGGSTPPPGDETRYQMCHGGQTISVTAAEARAHAAHGDTRGACPPPGGDTPPADDDEVVICHGPGVENETLTILWKDRHDHIAHGDYRGACR